MAQKAKPVADMVRALLPDAVKWTRPITAEALRLEIGVAKKTFYQHVREGAPLHAEVERAKAEQAKYGRMSGAARARQEDRAAITALRARVAALEHANRTLLKREVALVDALTTFEGVSVAVVQRAQQRALTEAKH